MLRRYKHEKSYCRRSVRIGKRFADGRINKQVIDLTYEYSWAQLKLPDGTIVEGNVESWSDYEGDQLQVVIDGVTYLVHSSNIVMRH